MQDNINYFFYFKAICLPKKGKKRTLHWSIKHLFVLNQEERLFFLLCSALGINKKEEGKEEAREKWPNHSKSPLLA